MITVISGTIRPNNKTLQIAKYYVEELNKKGQKVKLLNIQDLPTDFVFNNETMGTKTPEFRAIVEKYIIPASKFVVISPEYNGSFPGALKAFFDGIDPDDFRNKKVALVGVASGRSGNARGMDQLTTIYNYSLMPVLPYKLSIPAIYAVLDENGLVKDDKVKAMMEKQMEMFIGF
jgi:NAD(P)H-dependent FMN reductase